MGSSLRGQRAAETRGWALVCVPDSDKLALAACLALCGDWGGERQLHLFRKLSLTVILSRCW